MNGHNRPQSCLPFFSTGSMDSETPAKDAQDQQDARDEELSTKTWLLETRAYITNRTQLSVLYHRKRERFYALLDRWAKAGSLIAGTAAFSSLLPSADAKSVAGFMVAIVTLPGLVFAWNDKARSHAEFAQKFALIEAEVVADGWGNLTSAKFDLWLSRIIAIEATEPLIMFNLLMMCSNQIKMNKYEPRKLVTLPWWRRWTAHWIDLTPPR